MNGVVKAMENWIDKGLRQLEHIAKWGIIHRLQQTYTLVAVLLQF